MLAAHVQLYIHFCLFYLFVKEYVCTCYSAVAEYKVNRITKGAVETESIKRSIVNLP